jgi:aryl-alcohol dehydrogenase-like predicted oxidoreductase
MMEKRRLGRTGHLSSVVIFGAAALSEVDQAAANQSLDLALQHGINHIDVAPSYGQAEERVGPWLKPHRDKFFLGCKTMERTRDGAWAELERSLKRLQVDKLELHQLHAVTSFDEMRRALQPGGAIEALQQAREQGITRWLGITGHGIDTPAIYLEALERFDFDTVMFPLHPRLYADSAYRRDAEKLLDICIQRDIGAMIIKSVTKGPWGQQAKTHTTWYEPYNTQERINEGVRFALSQAGVAGIPSAGDVRLLPMVLEAAEHYYPMEAAEQAALIERSAALEPLFT